MPTPSSVGSRKAEKSAVGQEGSTREEALYANDETFGSPTPHTLIVAFQPREGTILYDYPCVGTELDLAWHEKLQLLVGDVLIELHKVFHLFVGHYNGFVVPLLWMYLKLKQGIVFLLQHTHLRPRGLDEEEIAYHWAIADDTLAVPYPHHALIALKRNESFHFSVLFQDLDGCHLSTIR